MNLKNLPYGAFKKCYRTVPELIQGSKQARMTGKLFVKHIAMEETWVHMVQDIIKAPYEEPTENGTNSEQSRALNTAVELLRESDGFWN